MAKRHLDVHAGANETTIIMAKTRLKDIAEWHWWAVWPDMEAFRHFD